MSDGATPRRRPSPNVAAAITLAVVAAAVVLWQRPWQGDGPADVAVPADAARQLTTQVAAIGEASSRDDLRRAAGPGDDARRWADDVWQARRTLDVQDVRLRYLDGGEAADARDGTTSARVQVAWRPGRDSVLGDAPTREVTVALRLAPTRDGRLAVRSVGRSGDDPVPVWLAGAVRVVRPADDVVVVEVDGGSASTPVDTLATRAEERVRRLVPSAAGRLVVVAPARVGETAALLGRTTAQVRRIAAVTTTLDGTARADRVVVLNPALFATMDERAAQVVMSHEATHLLTGTVGRSLPTWVAEGYADFVALDGDTAPLSVSAGQVLRQVRAGDVPSRLPTKADFADATHLGAVYESTWLVFRMLGERYGERRVTDFYAAVLRGTATDRALERAFGLDERTLTREWRAYLTKMASTVS